MVIDIGAGENIWTQEEGSAAGWGKFCSEVLHDWYCSTYVARISDQEVLDS